jgi:hypothetical protein
MPPVYNYTGDADSICLSAIIPLTNNKLKNSAHFQNVALSMSHHTWVAIVMFDDSFVDLAMSMSPFRIKDVVASSS